MRSISLRFLSLSLIALSACAFGVDENADNPMSAYLAALSATNHGEASADDVEHVLGYYDEDIVYEHPAVGIILEGVEAQRQGLTAFLNSYAGNAADSTIDVIDYIEGPNVVVLRLRVEFLLRREAAIEKISREQLRVIETKDGKITRMIDYW